MENEELKFMEAISKLVQDVEDKRLDDLRVALERVETVRTSPQMPLGQMLAINVGEEGPQLYCHPLTKEQMELTLRHEINRLENNDVGDV